MISLKQELTISRQHLQGSEKKFFQNKAELEQLKEKHQLLDQNFDHQKECLKKQNEDFIILKEQANQNQRQLERYKNELSDKNNQLLAAEKQIAVLHDQCHRLQQNLSNSEDKIEALRHEKLFLIQEKVQIENHLKQLSQTTL